MNDNTQIIEENNLKGGGNFRLDDLSAGWNSLSWSWCGTAVRFKLYIPRGYKPDGTTPMLVFLHGDGSNSQTVDSVINGGEAVVAQRAISEDKRSLILVPVSTKSWLKTPNDYAKIYPYRSYDMREAVPSDELLTVVRLMEKVKNDLNADSTRVYLSGYSRGTMAIWWILRNYPERFTAAVVCCGAGDPEVSAFKDIPVWIFQSKDDPLVSVDGLREIAQALKNAGGTVKYTEVDGYGHGLTQPLKEEKTLLDWLFSFKKPNA